MELSFNHFEVERPRKGVVDCIVVVDYRPGKPEFRRGNPDRWTPGEAEEMEIKIFEPFVGALTRHEMDRLFDLARGEWRRLQGEWEETT